jgi:hypothetical protein
MVLSLYTSSGLLVIAGLQSYQHEQPTMGICLYTIDNFLGTPTQAKLVTK